MSANYTRLAFKCGSYYSGYSRNVHKTAADAIAERVNFSNAGKSLTGHRSFFGEFGQLPTAYRDRLQSDIPVTYVIKSYSTPIAWQRSNGSWVVPIHTYSNTTTNHQSTVWSILRELGIDTTFEWVPDEIGPRGGIKSTKRDRDVFYPANR